jgi:hypothetical protein
MDSAANKAQTLNESQFYMWRTLFALVHADQVVTDEERKFMEGALDKLTLTDYQRSILVSDTMEASDVGEMFKRITAQKDRTEFFHHARILVWCDGDFDLQEQEILQKLERTHVADVDFPALMKEVNLSFDDEEKENMLQEHKQIEKEIDSGGNANLLSALKKLFRPY